jgi:hypothetical protein
VPFGLVRLGRVPRVIMGHPGCGPPHAIGPSDDTPAAIGCVRTPQELAGGVRVRGGRGGAELGDRTIREMAIQSAPSIRAGLPGALTHTANVAVIQPNKTGHIHGQYPEPPGRSGQAVPPWDASPLLQIVCNLPRCAVNRGCVERMTLDAPQSSAASRPCAFVRSVSGRRLAKIVSQRAASARATGSVCNGGVMAQNRMALSRVPASIFHKKKKLKRKS